MADDAAKPAGSPLAAATDRIRESARWLLTAFAAVGVILAGGLQLSDIGELTLATPGRLAAAILGLLVALGAVGYAIGQAGSIATKSYMSLSFLTTGGGAAVRAVVEQDETLLEPHDNVAALAASLKTRVAQAQASYEAYVEAERIRGRTADADQPDPEAVKAATVAAKAAADQSVQDTAIAERDRRIRDNVLDIASYQRVRLAYEAALPRIAGAVVVAALALIAFAWGANPPAAPGAAEILPKTPSNITVVLSASPEVAARPKVDAILAQLGPNCDPRKVAAVALRVRGETYQVASVETAKCRAAWFEVDPSVGEVRARG